MTEQAAAPSVPLARRRGHALRFVFGPRPPEQMPERVAAAIEAEQDQSEILVSLIQLLAVATFAVLYTLAPKAFPAEVPFEPVPVTLAVYLGFTLLRLWLAWHARLPRWFLALSVVVDVTVLMVTIWSFHVQYQAPAALYLKALTLMYAFIFIALRTLRFEPTFVILAGVSASLGWLVLVAYAVLLDPRTQITRDFREYMMSYNVLLGAEFDKIVSLLMVTAILAVALVRARRLLVRATTEQIAATELARFLAPEVTGRIRATEAAIRPGEAELREAAILVVDLRGFTPLTHMLAPREVMSLLSAYQARVIAAVSSHGGSIDKFMGDGILASFGATHPSTTYAADALRTVEVLLASAEGWAAERRRAGLPAPLVGAAVATGKVMFGAIGDASRLDYTVIGEPVNLAAKLEKHTKVEGVRALCTQAAFKLARAQGYVARPGQEVRSGRAVEGVFEPLDLVVLA